MTPPFTMTLLATGRPPKHAEGVTVSVENPASDDSTHTDDINAKSSKPRPTHPTPNAPVPNLGFIQLMLRVVAGSSTATLLGVFLHARRWNTLMEMSGFVDYSLASLTSQLTLLPCVFAIVMWMVSEFGIDLRVLSNRPRLFHVYMRAFRVAGCCALAGSIGVLTCGMDIPQQTMMRLATQTDAVASFNRGYCEAWCRNKPEGCDAFMRGDCGPNQSTDFDDLLATIDVKGWCKHAIAKQNYELVAEYDCVAPFAGLKAKGAFTHAMLALVA